jgi:hypothetical protein
MHRIGKIKGREKMSKILTIVTVAALLSVFSLGGTAMAQRAKNMQQSGGKCPVGTCSNNGGGHAKDVKNCSASNCSKK